MYFLNQYLELYISCIKNVDACNEWTTCVYKKIHEYYRSIRFNKMIPKNKDERKVVLSLINTLQEVEDNVIQFIPKEYPLKRQKHFVDYYNIYK